MKKVIIAIGFIFVMSQMAMGTVRSSTLSQKELDRAATKVYKTALDQMKTGNYWKAAQNLIVITDYYSDYKNLDAVLYNLGTCLFHLELYNAAEKIYVYLIKNYLDSPYVANAVYGLERVYYTDRMYNKALTYFQVITEKFPTMNEMDGAYYYAGQSYFYLNDYTQSILTLKRVSSKSSFRGYALYTMGLGYLKKKISIRPLSHSNIS
ncbi:MAG: tetratricopeptide repeat protein [Calditrichaeota bacterium]|nr:tetratricopeptide repeat protein [Calditrichota bacterium]